MLKVNGQDVPTWKWVSGGLVALVTAGLMFFMGLVASRIESMNQNMSKMSDTMTEIQVELGKQGALIASIERQAQKNEQAIRDLEKQTR